ncbi:PREDICTED: baculoviral IAP repeat-containing protein 7 [Dipodomys ordii]|uniref:RING-type E3 ubiquitin transferase n=1 Tax=Dipodomys ordii TaxID=10020 RepID=A0A1S3GCR1_DIPOR|nr:PREDICTED: baculoviral IAP repeat-containing protein 7 [Dipodomys ordii]
MRASPTPRPEDLKFRRFCKLGRPLDLVRAHILPMGPKGRAKCQRCGQELSPRAACPSTRQESQGPHRLCRGDLSQDRVDGQILGQLRPLTDEEEEGAGATSPQGPAFPEMSSEELRLASFYDWPSTTSVQPELLAAAGFFHTGSPENVGTWGRGLFWPWCDLDVGEGGRQTRWWHLDLALQIHAPHESPECLVTAFHAQEVPFSRPSTPRLVPAPDSRHSHLNDHPGLRVGCSLPMARGRVLFLTEGEGAVDSPATLIGPLQRCRFLLWSKGRGFIHSVQEAWAPLLRPWDRWEDPEDMAPVAPSGPVHRDPDPEPRGEIQPECAREPGIRDAEEQLRRLQEERMCKVCLDRAVSVVFVPCGHLVCADCAPSLQQCPICRAAISSCVRTFLS